MADRRVNGSAVGLVARLLRATEEGQIGWEQVGSDAYQVTLRESTVVIYPRDHDGVAPYRLDVRSGPGPATIIESGSESGLIESENIRMNELFRAAKLSSVTSSPAVQAVLRELERLDEPPF